LLICSNHRLGFVVQHHHARVGAEVGELLLRAVERLAQARELTGDEGLGGGRVLALPGLPLLQYPSINARRNVPAK
jgi:hypothetical protein